MCDSSSEANASGAEADIGAEADSWAEAKRMLRRGPDRFLDRVLIAARVAAPSTGFGLALAAGVPNAARGPWPLHWDSLYTP